MKRATALLTAGLLACSVPAFASVDGTADGSYGLPLVVQTTQTQFGDNGLGVVDYANGSELDAAFGYVSGGVLYLVLAGNLESNFNKLELFLDSKSGGQQQLRGDNPNVDFNGLNRMAGLWFDNGFEPDYYITVTGGGGPYAIYSNYAELLSGGGGNGYYLGQGGAVSGGALSGGTNPNNILISINNINVGGVGAGCGAASGAGVNTGIELAIPLAALGLPPSGGACIKAAAFINGGGHDYVSNQVLGPLAPGTCNLGEPSLVDFRQHAGNQYFEVCDLATPASTTTWGRVKTLYR